MALWDEVMEIFLQRNARDHQMIDLYTKRIKNGHLFLDVYATLHIDLFENDISEKLGENREVKCELEVS